MQHISVGGALCISVRPNRICGAFWPNFEQQKPLDWSRPWAICMMGICRLSARHRPKMITLSRLYASIFVNPTQFGSAEDLEKYPRDMDRDLTMLRDAGVAAVFTPTPDIMYHPDAQTIVETADLANKLMGALRPGHFRGVATVVTKLFNLFQPSGSAPLLTATGKFWCLRTCLA